MNLICWSRSSEGLPKPVHKVQMYKLFKYSYLCFGSTFELMFCQSFFLLALFTMLLHYLAFSDNSDLSFPYIRRKYRSQSEVKLITFLSEILIPMSKSTASQFKTQPDTFCQEQKLEKAPEYADYSLREIVLQCDKTYRQNLKRADWSSVMAIHGGQFMQRNIIRKFGAGC